MNINDEILINKYGQGLLSDAILVNKFDTFKLEEKRNYLTDLSNLIIQSKPIAHDVDIAIQNSNLKPTFTPCVLLKKEISNNALYKVIELPENELGKAFRLFINLFKVAYERRYYQEKDDSNKWWYWDLSDENKIKKIKNMFFKSEAP
jgi:hypothetical protein